MGVPSIQDSIRSQMDGAGEHGGPRGPLLVAYLASNDAPCPVCSYNLRGLLVSTCPECNAPLSLGVTSENLSVGPWTLGVVSFAMGAGFDGVVATLITIMQVANPTPQWQVYALLGMFFTLALVCLAVVITLVRKRRRWAFKPRPVQWRWAIMCLGIVFLTHAAIGLTLAFTINV